MEVMTTAAVLSFGLVMIYRAFFTALDYYQHVAYRLHALLHIQNKITMIQSDRQLNNRIVLNQEEQLYQTTINNRPIHFQLYMQVEALDGIPGLYQLSVTASWREGARDVSISRTTYIGRVVDEDEA